MLYSLYIRGTKFLQTLNSIRKTEFYMNLNKLFASATFFFLLSFSFAQPMTRLVREAKKMYSNENYCEAAEKCQIAYKQISKKGRRAKKRKSEMAFKVAECYRHIEQIGDAQEWYDRCLLLDYEQEDPEVLYLNAMMLHQMGEFDKAIKNLDEYKTLVPTDSREEVLRLSCTKATDYKSNRSRHVIENQSAINKPEFDMSAVFGDRKESKLYFSSSRPGSVGTLNDPRSCENYMDIWVTQKDKKGNWGEPFPINGELINTEDNEGAVCFDGRNKLMFFTRCPNEKNTHLGCEIWVSDAKGKDFWDEPRRLLIKPNDSVSVGHPCASDDGKYLVFVSDQAGGYGGKDLWYSTYDKKKDEWSRPENLGPEINTAGDELFPTFGKDGDLFFSSNGLPGMGSLDIFKATKVGEEYKWENPTNVGAPINSETADFSLYELDERSGYFTSERKSENGTYKSDIYSYYLPPNLYDLRIVITELGDKDKIVPDAKVVISGSDGSKIEGFTNERGNVFWEKKPNGDRFINEEISYNIQIEKKGFHEDLGGSQFTTKELDYGRSFIIEMSLLPKRPIRLPEVRYPLGSAVLLVDSTFNSKDSLNFVYNLLKEYPGMVLELSSHTDARGSDKANQKLSEERAKSCVDYLVNEKGVDPARLLAVGKGEREPAEWIDPETSDTLKLIESYINEFKTSDKGKFEMLHQLNRRTEGRVVRMDYTPLPPVEEPKEEAPETEEIPAKKD
jgi:peptidoglycan-associated lipoprotein